GSTNDGTAVVQSSYNGSASQQWAIQTLGNQQSGTYLVSPASKLASTLWPVAGSMNTGTAILVTGYGSPDSQKWLIAPL
ncbi:MAG TPA: RICIN domain-containing protein, partial [Polyangia bacterium]|nr:RICIN domain-containing protein [Polyangia bacterium]